MKTRLKELPATTGYGRLTVDLPGKGSHALRLPTWSQAARIANAWTGRPDGDGMWEYLALLVGASWAHETLELETPFPDAEPTHPKLAAYAIAVERELEDAGYHSRDLNTLGGAVLDALRARTQERVEAAQLADFSGPPAARTSSA